MVSSTRSTHPHALNSGTVHMNSTPERSSYHANSPIEALVNQMNDLLHIQGKIPTPSELADAGINVDLWLSQWSRLEEMANGSRE